MYLATRILALFLVTGTDRADSPVLLDFGAEWCAPCRATRPHVQELKRRGYPVREIDVDEDVDKLSKKFHVSSVPTFIVVGRDGREIDRITGARTATELASFYDEAAESAAQTPSRPTLELASANAPANPWETVVRIKVQITHPRPAIGYGSGTIIHSDSRQTIILTCAHIFHIEGQRNQFAPTKFPYPVLVDLFDGQLAGGETPRVNTAEADLPAKVIDYDFVGDVALIRIEPGKRLPASRVVPPGWSPAPGLKMTTVGCSQGKDATAWTTQVTRPHLVLQKGPNSLYEATECLYAPIQGRSGGGLFTMDGLLAGVCDFNDAPRGAAGVHKSTKYHGLYASPKTIHKLLEKHELQICYAPIGRQRGDELMADTRTARDSDKVRLQSPDSRFPVPSPEVLGVRLENQESHVRPSTRLASTREPSSNNLWRSVNNDSTVTRSNTADSVMLGEHDSLPVGLQVTPVQRSFDLFDDDRDHPSDNQRREVRREAGSSRSRDAWRSASPDASQ
jgi:hypothetical protein